jgi:hypothetical protein
MWAPNFFVHKSATRDPLVHAARSFLSVSYWPHRAKLSPWLFVEYSANDRLRILLGDTLFKPSWALTMFNSGRESFHRQDDGRHFDTTFSPVSRILVLWGIWSADCSNSSRKVAVACSVWVYDFTNPTLPCWLARIPLLGFTFHR